MSCASAMAVRRSASSAIEKARSCIARIHGLSVDGERSSAAVMKAREQAADWWLGWATDKQHEHRPGAPVNTQYVYDSKFKINAYGALLGEYKAMYGAADGQKLAVGESGPLDEAYVGGGS